jgi:hypothetical protein
MAEKAYFVTASRLLDNRKIYIKAYLDVKSWTVILDALHDSEFVVKKITHRDYSNAIETSKPFIYNLDFKNYKSFADFIISNYIRTLLH